MQSTIRAVSQVYNRVFSWFQYTDGVVSFLIRLVLAPVLIYAGWEKITGDNWFASIAESMPPPFNVLPVEASWFLASWTEFLGGIALLLGLFTRFWAFALAVTMFVAAYAVHLPNGWAAVAPSNPPEVCIPGTAEHADAGFAESWIRCYNVNARTIEASKRLDRAKAILREHGNFRYLNGSGSLVKLNSGIEFATLYMLMLLSLVLIGGGRWLSMDYWLARVFSR